MPKLETLTVAEIERYMKSSVQKGYSYVTRMRDLVRDGQTLSAQVQGGWLYQVQVTLNDDNIESHCTCSWGGNCKHVAAVLLRWRIKPNDFVNQDTVTRLPGSELPVTAVEPPATSCPSELPAWITSTFALRRQMEIEDLGHQLEQLTIADLRALAKQHDWSVKGTHKQAIAEQIARQMIVPATIRAAFKNQDPEHRSVLCATALLEHSAGVTVQGIGALASTFTPLAQFKQLATYSRHLYEAGLVLPGNLASYEPWYKVPDVLVRHFAPFLSARPQPEGAAGDKRHAPSVALGDPYPFVRAVNQVMMLLEQAPPRLRSPMPRPQAETYHQHLQGWDYDPVEIATALRSNALRPYSTAITLTVPPPQFLLPDEEVERLAPLSGGAERLEWTLALSQAVGLLQPGSPLTVHPAVKEHYLRLDEVQQMALLARTYFQMTNWNELWPLMRAGRVQIRRRFGYAVHKPHQLWDTLQLLRQVTVRVLACFADNQWLSPEDLAATIGIMLNALGWIDQDRKQPNLDWWFLAPAGQTRPLERDEWLSLLTELVQLVVSGPLHWLGLTDLQWVEKKGQQQLTVFRTHGLSDLYWDRVDALPPAALATSAAPLPTGTVVVEDDVIAVNPAAVNVQAHRLLERLARLETTTTTQFVYRLDAQTVWNSFEAGISFTELVDEWERLLSVAMPETIRQRLEAWEESYGRVRIYQNITVIELGDEYVLAEMKAVTSLAEHVVAEISPRLVIIEQKAVATLTAELEKAGYTPRQVNEAAANA